jgi:hypothetical protein
VSDPPLIPSSLYGLRTWGTAADAGGERLTGAFRGTPWPDGGAWLKATCDRGDGHAAPGPVCDCGIHAWHPRPPAAREVLGSRREVPGVVELAGAIEVHEDGLRGERGRPHALVLTPRANAALVRRLARRHDAQVAEVDGPDALLAWCRERGLGLDPPQVDALLGPEEAGRLRRARRRRRRRDLAKVAVATLLAGALVIAGLAVTGDPGDRELYGRTGKVQPR